MFTRVAFVVVSIILIVPAISFSQGETAFPSLTLTPGAEAHGMGETSVAVLSEDPVAVIVNPAHLGMQSLGGLFGFGYNHSNWLPSFQLSDLYYRTYAFSTGINLRRSFGIAPELALGLSYSRVHFNLAENAYESSNNFTIGLGFNYWIKFAAGVSFKHAKSQTAVFLLPDNIIPVVTEVNLHDVGLLLKIPVIGITNRFRERPIKIADALLPSLDLSLGITRNNLGPHAAHYSEGGSDLLPRYARAGFSIALGFDIMQEQNPWRAFSSRLSVESNDLLIASPESLRDVNGTVIGLQQDYQDELLGDIHFFDEVILGHTNIETVKKKGWELSFFEMLSVRWGRFEEDENRGNRRYSTSGFSMQLGGMLKLLQASHVIGESDGAVGFLIKHLDIRYHHSSIDTDEENHPLDKTTYNSVNLLIRN